MFTPNKCSTVSQTMPQYRYFIRLFELLPLSSNRQKWWQRNTYTESLILRLVLSIHTVIITFDYLLMIFDFLSLNRIHILFTFSIHSIECCISFHRWIKLYYLLYYSLYSLHKLFFILCVYCFDGFDILIISRRR